MGKSFGFHRGHNRLTVLDQMRLLSLYVYTDVEGQDLSKIFEVDRKTIYNILKRHNFLFRRFRARVVAAPSK